MMPVINKSFLLGFIVLVACCCSWAESKKSSTVDEDAYYIKQIQQLKNSNPHNVADLNDYTYVQIGFWTKFPKSVLTSNVFGWKMGFPFSAGYGRVFGLESALLACTTDRVKGMQVALVNVAVKIDGVQAGLVNVAEQALGVQVGLVNVSQSTGCQIGLINYIEGAWLPCWPFCNVSF